VVVCVTVVHTAYVNVVNVYMKKQKRLTTTVPPKRGPVPQGLKINSNKIQIVKTNKKGT